MCINAVAKKSLDININWVLCQQGLYIAFKGVTFDLALGEGGENNC